MLTLLKGWLLPPGALVLLLVLGVIVLRRWPRMGRSIVLGTLVLLWLLSTPRGASILMAPLENSVPIAPASQWPQAGALVVLSGGRQFNQPQLGGRDDVSPMAMERLVNAARIERQTGLPILTSGGGGKRGSDDPPEADLMAQRLADSFGLSTRWREIQSHNTAQNAEYSAAILKRAGIDTIILVTNAWHMPRAARNFRQQGMTVLPAPTGFTARAGFRPVSLTPDPSALRHSYWALHEYLGLLAGR